MTESEDNIASMSREELQADLLDWAHKTSLARVLKLPSVFTAVKLFRPNEVEFIRQMQNTLVVAAAWFTSGEGSDLRKEITKIADQVSIAGDWEKTYNDAIREEGKISEQAHRERDEEIKRQVQELQTKIIQAVWSHAQLNCHIQPANIPDWALAIFEEQAAAQNFSADLVFSLTELCIVEFPLNIELRRSIRDQYKRLLVAGKDPIEAMEELNEDLGSQVSEKH